MYGHGFNSTGIDTNFYIFHILLTTLFPPSVTQAFVVYLLVMLTILDIFGQILAFHECGM